MPPRRPAALTLILVLIASGIAWSQSRAILVEDVDSAFHQHPGFGGAVGFADYDNDGDLDLLACGSAGGGVCNFYVNNDGNLTLDVRSQPPGLYYGRLAWGDYDLDGDPDAVSFRKRRKINLDHRSYHHMIIQ